MTEPPTADGFAQWADRWMELAAAHGPKILDEKQKIDAVSALWAEPVPGVWLREDVDDRLKEPKYQRSHSGKRRGEHVLEYEILVEPRCEQVLGERMIDGVNAVPLVRSEKGSRRGDVEADLLLLLGTTKGKPTRQVLCELKVTSQHAWYAVVEAARQLKLCLASPSCQRLFRERGQIRNIPDAVPTASLVVAPESFYTAKQQRANSVAPANRLCERLKQDHGVEVSPAVWDAAEKEIRPLATG